MDDRRQSAPFERNKRNCLAGQLIRIGVGAAVVIAVTIFISVIGYVFTVVGLEL